MLQSYTLQFLYSTINAELCNSYTEKSLSSLSKQPKPLPLNLLPVFYVQQNVKQFPTSNLAEIKWLSVQLVNRSNFGEVP